MGLELTILGSGCFAPGRGRPVRNPAGHAVRAGESLVLFDLGFGNVRQLARARLPPEDVSDVFLTHVHPDHCGDLPALLFLFRCDRKPRSGRLRVWGPSGARELVAGLCRAWRPWLDPRGYALEVRELGDGGQAAGADWVVEAKKVPHTAPALAYRLTRGASSLVYTGDTEYDESIAAFASSCGLLLVECTSDEDDAVPGHLSPRQALELVRRSGCREALLTHLSDASAAAAARLLPGEPRAALARDRMRRKI
ncbi:MAG: ribonuclease Z [Elusimicrobia bacterium]|nr:ribonuclease Z [Elusimicrobiota bacterium]